MRPTRSLSAGSSIGQSWSSSPRSPTCRRSPRQMPRARRSTFSCFRSRPTSSTARNGSADGTSPCDCSTWYASILCSDRMLDPDMEAPCLRAAPRTRHADDCPPTPAFLSSAARRPVVDQASPPSDAPAAHYLPTPSFLGRLALRPAPAPAQTAAAWLDLARQPNVRSARRLLIRRAAAQPG